MNFCNRMEIFTIGHSTLPFEDFLRLLRDNAIKLVADVRTIPKSRFNPQYNLEDLSRNLAENGVGYVHMAKLGGLRKARKDSINLGWKNESFRGFADYMQTDEFQDGLNELIGLAEQQRVAMMCAESVPWRCHRSLISDALFVKGVSVFHILKGKIIDHKLTSFAKISDGNLFYPF